jgi:hypothetical protein
MATDQVSFYDESLKKQIEGSFKTDGKSIHVSSAYGTKSLRVIRAAASLRTFNGSRTISNLTRCEAVEALAVGAAGTVRVLTLERGRGLTHTHTSHRENAVSVIVITEPILCSGLFFRTTLGAVCQHDSATRCFGLGSSLVGFWILLRRYLCASS